MARDALFFTSKFSNNSIVIIDVLGESDLQTAIHLKTEMDDAISVNRSDYCRYFKVRSTAEFFDVLNLIDTEVQSGLRPILHIESHGDKELGIQIGVSREFIPWSQLLPKFQQINKNSKNNLGVVMAGCFGLYAITPLCIEEPCPFYFLIGSDEKVIAGYIDDVMKLFYLELIESKNLDKAMKKVDAKFKQFHAEKFFYITFAKYTKQACMGLGAQQRVERLLTNVVEGGSVANRAALRSMRKNAKTFVRSHERQERAFNEHSARFLHGRRSVTYDVFRKFVRGEL